MRGLNDPLKQSKVRKFIKQYQLNYVGLVETRVKEHNKKTVESGVAKVSQ